MKCYAWRWYESIFRPGIPVAAGDTADSRPRLHLAALKRSRYNEDEPECHPKSPLPPLNAELAKSFALHTTDPAFSPTQLSLLRCDAEMRAELWLTPERNENDDTALIFFTLNTREPQFVTVSGTAEILFQTTFWQWNEQTVSLATLAKVPRGGSLIMREKCFLGFMRQKEWRIRDCISNDDGALNHYDSMGKLKQILVPRT